MAESADVIFVFDGDDSGLAAASKRVVKELRDTRTAFDNMRKAAKAGDAEVRKLGGGLDDLDLGRPEAGARKFTLSAEKMGQAVGLVNPRLGELTAKVGSLGAAGGPLVALAAVTVAAGAAYIGLGAAAVGAINDIDALTESLDGQRRATLAPYIANIEQVRDTFTEIGDAFTETQIRLLSQFATAIDDVSEAVLSLVVAYNKLDATTGGLLSAGIVDVAGGPLLDVAQTIGIASRLVGAAQTDFNIDERNPLIVTPETGFDFQNNPKPDENALRKAEQAQTDAERRAAERQAARDKEFADITSLFAEIDADIIKQQQAAYDEGFALFSAQWDAQVAYAQKSQDAIVEAGRRSVLAQAEQQEYLREVEAARMAQREERERQMADASIALTYGVADATISALSQSLAAQAKSARESWEIQQATALATALINVPASILTGLSQGGPVLAAVNGVLAGIQFAAIAAARPPQYHVGGYAPDEVPSGGMTLRDTERTAVVTPAGQQYLTPAMLAAINSGAMNRAETPPIYLLVDGVAQRARRLATNPGTGYSTSGGRRG